MLPVTVKSSTAAAALLLLAAGLPARAQDQSPPPKAQLVPDDEPLVEQPEKDSYDHCKNVYDQARLTSDVDAKLSIYAAAIELFQGYITRYPNGAFSEAAWWWQGQSYYYSGRIEDAKRCYQHILSRSGKSDYAAAAAYTLGADHFNHQQYALAAPFFEKQASIATKPEDRQRGNYLAGLCYKNQGRNNEASNQFSKVVADEGALNPYRTRSQVELAKILALGPKQAEALQLFEEVAAADTTAEVRGDAALKAGALAAKLGDAPKSDKYFMQVMNTPGMESFRPTAQLGLMTARFDQKRFQDVINIYKQNQAPAVGEEEASRLMLAGRAYLALKNNLDAIEAFRQVERLGLPNADINMKASFLRLQCFFIIKGRNVPDQVDAFLQLYEKGRPNDPRIHRAIAMKAESLFDDKRTAQAAKAYQAIDINKVDESWRPTLLFHRAFSLADAGGDTQGVIRSTSAVIQGFPNFADIPECLILRAKAYSDSGDTVKAVVDYDTLINRSDKPELRTQAMMLSADLTREQGDFPQMNARYLQFLKNGTKPSDGEKAKASFWLSWGLMKQKNFKEMIPYAEDARKLDGKSFGTRAGQLLCLAFYGINDPEHLGSEIDLAIKGNYADQIQEPVVRWAAEQAYHAGRFEQAARFYDLIVDNENPNATPVGDWRFYSKALLESNEAKKALPAIKNVLDVEVDPKWRADGFLDRGRAEFALGHDNETQKAINDGLDLQPAGSVKNGLQTLNGDLAMKKGNPRDATKQYVSPLENMDDADPKKRETLEKMLKALEATKDADLPQRQQTIERYQKMLEKYPKK